MEFLFSIIPFTHPVFFYLFIFWIFFCGACVGSFVDVVRVRKSWRRSLRKPSHCVSCLKKLVWYELFPIFSYIALRGKCRKCSLHIPKYHIVSETLMGILFVCAIVFSDSFTMIGVIILSAFFLVPIVLSDIESLEVPEHFSLPFAYITFGIAFAAMLVTGNIFSVTNGLFLAAPFYLLWLLSSGRAIGLGDAKLALSLGFLVPTVSHVIPVFVYTFWIGALGIMLFAFFGLLSTGSFGVRRGMQIPLVPSMVVAYFLVFFTSITLLTPINWIQHFF